MEYKYTIILTIGAILLRFSRKKGQKFHGTVLISRKNLDILFLFCSLNDSFPVSLTQLRLQYFSNFIYKYFREVTTYIYSKILKRMNAEEDGLNLYFKNPENLVTLSL